MKTHRSIALLGAALSIGATTYHASGGQEVEPSGAKPVLRVVDVNHNGIIEAAEWEGFGAVKIMAKVHGIDTSQPLRVEDVAVTFDASQRSLTGVREREKSGEKIETRFQSKVRVSKLPVEFQLHDRNQDGQISLSEWPRSERGEFFKFDRNGDGFLESREIR